MAQPRVPTSQQFTYVSPSAATQGTAPPLPSPGPASQDAADPLPLLAFNPSPSPLQQGGNQAAVGGSPGMAGPLATVPTTQMQDFGQPMGRTGGVLPSTSTGGSP